MFNRNTKFLVIDDMNTMRVLIKRVLTGLGFENIVEAKGGTDALDELELAHAKKKPVEIILSDWNMPDLDGLSLLKKIKADDKFKKIPFIMLTANGEFQDIEAANKAGANAYITKPFTAAQLNKELATLELQLKG